jgi:hypothetical protein
MKVDKNFLQKKDFLDIKKIMTNPEFPWFFGNRNFDLKSIFNQQFCHIFYRNYTINSNFFNLLNPLIEKLKPKALIRIKANMTLPSDKIYENLPPHVDFDFDCKTSIFYMNTNNGYTMLGSKKIKSEENKILTFDSNKEHFGTNCTNQPFRMVININYV